MMHMQQVIGIQLTITVRISASADTNLSLKYAIGARKSVATSRRRTRRIVVPIPWLKAIFVSVFITAYMTTTATIATIGFQSILLS